MNPVVELPPALQNKKMRTKQGGGPNPEILDENWLNNLVLESGAEDVGFVSIDNPAVQSDLKEIREAFPAAKALISFVVRMNREPIRTPMRSISNLEFHHAGDRVNEVAASVVKALERKGIRALNPSMGFPMEMDRFPNKIWVVSHKNIAVAAGLGRIGIHRNVIHLKFGNFILLGSILIDREVSDYTDEIDYNPCLECKLCRRMSGRGHRV